MVERGIPRQHYIIKDAEGNIIGEVTSGTQSPSLNKAIGMGYVSAAFSKADSEIFIEIRDKVIKAKVVKIPFL
jgi:aminomethyltransferase